ncbi:MAG: hypothetical protein OIN66_13795 [Candidatus Methanoperedens sp.]|nr:hypothetical protein [Candidatus Methanoperedens sp.]
MASLDQFFLNEWEVFETGWLVKIITLPGYISHQIPYYKLPILYETLGGLLSILVPAIIGGGIGVLIHRMNKRL